MSRLQPRSKAVSTSNISSQSASATSATTAAISLSNSPPKDVLSSPESVVPRLVNRSSSIDPVSDRSTLFLIRRTLCSHLGEKGRNTPAPIDEILPPLTSSNEVDLQLYAFIAIIIREFVNTWYTKITPDPLFVEEVVKIIAHCTRALEQRLRNVDLESVLFDELPDLLDVHLQAHRAAHSPSHPPPIERKPREIYHSLWPMPALTPVVDKDGGPLAQQQMNNEALYRQMLVQGVLAVLLPTEDLDNDCLTTLVGQIFSEMILGNGIGGKASEPWLLWEGITKIVEIIQAQLPGSKASARVARSNSDLRRSPQPMMTRKPAKNWAMSWNIQTMFWLALQYAFVAFTTIRFVIGTLATASSLPSRTADTRKPSTLVDDSLDKPQPELGADPANNENLLSRKIPIMKMRVWTVAAHLLDLDFRMPWLGATISMFQWGALKGPGGLGNTNGMIDKILSDAIQTHVLDPSRIPSLLRSLRSAIFPNNTLAPPRFIPTPAEQLLMRRKCAETILALIPTRVQDVYFGVDLERRIAHVEDVLNVFDDAYCNKHLLYGIVELIIVRLMPELMDKGVEELFEERLS